MYKILSMLLLIIGIGLLISTKTDLFASYTESTTTIFVILGFILLCSLVFFSSKAYKKS